jgi:hypothetical protein
MHTLEELHKSDLGIVSPFKMSVRWETREGLWIASYGNFCQDAIDRRLALLTPEAPSNSGSEGTAGADHKVFLYPHREYPCTYGRIDRSRANSCGGSRLLCTRLGQGRHCTHDPQGQLARAFI